MKRYEMNELFRKLGDIEQQVLDLEYEKILHFKKRIDEIADKIYEFQQELEEKLLECIE